ncbi:GGDEF domain-containing response regulator [Argonema antarcticum]|uniref:EAL domain-containing response regulator n=1 Tax=Argonema antarcticum TaxID=2942763 RepID=UPI002011F922|nr:GGDEF domain-containing response regulator [Argonema antarcticum]MCL1472957.1 EAL domain-containing protein [Argonema antarcticum A004/B2]
MKKILVIEDTAEIRNNIQEFLEIQDFEVMEAQNGRIGLDLARKNKFDLILCDIMMPEMDGYSVISALREDPATADIPFIFLTAKCDRVDLRQGMNLGADDYITKPFTPYELLEAVTARLNRVAQQNEKLKQVSERVEHLENFDALTGLPNQSALQGDSGYFNEVISKADRNRSLVPFLLLGLDRFGRINDTVGYSNGNLILQKLAQRLISFTERTAGAAVARVSGDEFALVLPPVIDQESAVAKAQDILKLIAQPLDLNGKSIPLTGSIGIAFYPTAWNVEELQKQASIAMSSAKSEGGNRCSVYTRPIFGHEFSRDLQLTADFQQAWERKELQVFYQPRIDLRNQKIVALGAVVHWQHPSRGLISLEKTLSVAEEAGLTVPLNEWILRIACQQAKVWRQSRVFARVAVSLPTQLFIDNNVESKIVSAYEDAGLDPQFLELEIAADTIASIANVNATARKLMTWRDVGIQTTISSFGLKHASLDYLESLVLNNLKMEPISATKVLQNAPILNAIIQMAHRLKLRVVAEGVQTEAEAVLLKKQKCDEIQWKESLPAKQLQNLAKGIKGIRISN